MEAVLLWTGVVIALALMIDVADRVRQPHRREPPSCPRATCLGGELACPFCGALIRTRDGTAHAHLTPIVFPPVGVWSVASPYRASAMLANVAVRPRLVATCARPECIAKVRRIPTLVPFHSPVSETDETGGG